MNLLSRSFRVTGALTLCLIFVAHSAYAASGMIPVDDIIQMEKKPDPKVQLTEPADNVDTPLKGHIAQAGTLSTEDNRNLTLLWKKIVAKNPVIQYGLKQLATPPELRYAHSSIFARTLGGLLTGAAMIPYAMGAGQYASGATAIGANMVDRAMMQSRKIDPNLLPSDTELVELSGLVQGLQKNLMDNYFSYKNSLVSYVQQEQMAETLGRKYNQALSTPDPWDEMWVHQLFQDAKNRKFLSHQTAKRCYLSLERMVGVEGMKNMEFEEMQQASEPGKISTSPPVEAENSVK